MKKTLLVLGLLAAGYAAQAQVNVMVLQPAELAGSLEFTIAGSDWTLHPDMTNPDNRVQTFTAIGVDSLACDSLINPDDIAGKIAIVYRGACEFGLKALNCQNAGAVGCVIVNHSGAPVGMGAGANGALVTIPTVMISTDAGASIHDQVVAGNVEMLIGSLSGVYPDNLNLTKKDVLVPIAAAYPALLVENPGEFSVAVGSWIHNFGNTTAAAATLNLTIMNGSTTVYDETSTAVSIPAGDSTFVALPDFTQDNYNGRYDFTYTADLGGTDAFPSDNTVPASLTADSLLSLGTVDPGTNLPFFDEFYKPSGTYPVFGSCMQFIDAHASRIKANGIWSAASITSSGNINGIQMDARLYEWNDAVTGASDATFNSLSEIINGSYVYTDSAQTGTPIYIPFAEATQLTDNQRYLFCVSTSSPDIYIAHNTHTNYTQNQLQNDQLANITLSDQYYPGGWGDGMPPSLAISMADASIGIQEHSVENLTPYPNPAARSLTIPMKGNSGVATLTVLDSKGAQVLSKQVTVTSNNQLTLDVEGFQAGVYQFNMAFESGKRSQFRVVVSK